MINEDNVISRSLLAGMSISFGCILLLTTGTNLLGSLLFSVGILSVYKFNLNLFTDKACSLTGIVDLQRLSLVLILNLVMALALGFFMGVLDDSIRSSANETVMYRLDTSIHSIIASSLITGFLFSLISKFETDFSANHVVPIIAVIAIVTFGGCFCIADMFYYSASVLSLENFSSVFIRLILTVLFNFIGCCLYNLFVHKSLIDRGIV